MSCFAQCLCIPAGCSGWVEPIYACILLICCMLRIKKNPFSLNRGRNMTYDHGLKAVTNKWIDGLNAFMWDDFESGNVLSTHSNYVFHISIWWFNTMCIIVRLTCFIMGQLWLSKLETVWISYMDIQQCIRWYALLVHIQPKTKWIEIILLHFS